MTDDKLMDIVSGMLSKWQHPDRLEVAFQDYYDLIELSRHIHENPTNREIRWHGILIRPKILPLGAVLLLARTPPEYAEQSPKTSPHAPS